MSEELDYIAELREKYLQATDEGTSFAHLKSLERENTKLKQQIDKMKCCINDLVHLGEFNENTDEEYLNYQVHEALKQAVQFIKEIEKRK